jgi:hypothetical protein
MSKKDKASDAVALALAGVLTVTSVPAGSTSNSVPDALNHTAPITEMASINRSPMTLPPGVELPADISPGQSTQPEQAPPIRYMDLTKKADGWDFGQGLAINGSSNRRIVIVSYLDEATTASFLRIAESYRGGTTNLPIFGVLRSPLPPASVSRTPNPLGFDIFFDGTAIPPMERPDPRFTRTDQLSAFMRGIHRNYFAATASLGSDTRVAANMVTGGKSSGGTGSATGSGSAGGKSGGGTGDLAAVNFNPEF